MMLVTDQAFDTRVRAAVYDGLITGGAVPTLAAIAAALGSAPEADVAAALRRLAANHVLVLQPERDEILMASPFSAVPTPFIVEAGARTFWGNCVWDALGVLAMLGEDGRVRTSCGDCGAALALEVRGGALVSGPAVAHFAIPAKHWWDDIVFT